MAVEIVTKEDCSQRFINMQILAQLRGSVENISLSSCNVSCNVPNRHGRMDGLCCLIVCSVYAVALNHKI